MPPLWICRRCHKVLACNPSPGHHSSHVREDARAAAAAATIAGATSAGAPAPRCATAATAAAATAVAAAAAPRRTVVSLRLAVAAPSAATGGAPSVTARLLTAAHAPTAAAPTAAAARRNPLDPDDDEEADMDLTDPDLPPDPNDSAADHATVRAPPAQASLVTILGFFSTIDITGPDLHHVLSRSLDSCDRPTAAAASGGYIQATIALITDRSCATFAYHQAIPRLLLARVPKSAAADQPDPVLHVRRRAATLASGDAKGLWDEFAANFPLATPQKDAIKDPESDRSFHELSESFAELAELGAWGDCVQALEAVPTSPPTAETFGKLRAVQPTLPIDPELRRLRDQWYPHLADGAPPTDWPNAYTLYTKAELAALTKYWDAEVSTLKHGTAPDGTGWRGLFIKALFPYAKSETAILFDLISKHALPRQCIELLKMNSLVALLKPNAEGKFLLSNPKVRPIGKQNRWQTATFRPHARLIGKHGGPVLGLLGQMAMLKSGIEASPRQLSITRSRYPHSASRSEDAINAFPSLLRAAVLAGHRALQHHLQSLAAPTASQTRLLHLSRTSVHTYAVYRATPNTQWVNVGGSLHNLPASGAGVQGGILDMSDFCIPYTMLVLKPIRALHAPRLGAISIADDLYTEVRNVTPPLAVLADALDCSQKAMLDPAADPAAAADALDAAIHALGAAVVSTAFAAALAADAIATEAAAAIAAGAISTAAAIHRSTAATALTTLPPDVPIDIATLTAAAHDFIHLAAAIGVGANIPKVHTDQPIAAAGTPFDLQPHLGRFPANPKPTAALPAILPLTRDGYGIAGGWHGPSPACAAHVFKLVTTLRAAVDRLLDPRLAVKLQIRQQVFRACFAAQARLCHIQRSMALSDILAPLAAAAAVQHAALRRLFHIPLAHLPDDLASAANHPSLTVYAFHLPTDCGGCGLANPLLTAPAAAAGAAVSAQPVLRLSAFHHDLAADPASWPTSGIPILADAATALLRITAVPAYFTDPALYPDRHRAFTAALAGPDGRASLANIDRAVNRSPQSCLARINNRQIAADIAADSSLPNLTRAGFHASAAYNSGRVLIPFYITQFNRVSDEELLTFVQFRVRAPISFIGLNTRCLAGCKHYGPHTDPPFVIPGAFGPYYVTEDEHRHGCHQLSCRVGPYTHQRHNAFRTAILDGLARGGAVASSDEIFVSATNNQRADGCLWHPALSARGIAIDVTVWSDYTFARLPLSATTALYTLLAAESYKETKYKRLCDARNLDFAALAANPQGGFGPTLLRAWKAVWSHRIAQAKTAGLPTRALVSLERRCLEHISAVFARHLHKAIHARTTSRLTAQPDHPDDADGDAHLPADA